MNYKRNIINLGDSDVASIVVRSSDRVDFIKFGGDNSYKAYLIDERFEVPSHYNKQFTFSYWVNFIDDETVRIKIYAKKIEIYRAGEYGCLIKVEGFDRIEGAYSRQIPDFLTKK